MPLVIADVDGRTKKSVGDNALREIPDKKTMKIVLMIDWFIYYTVELANALANEHQVLLLTRDHSYEISAIDQPEDVDVFLDQCLDQNVGREKLKFRQGNPRGLLEVFRIYRKIKKFHPGIIHIQETTDWRILLLASLFGFRKIVLTVHDVVTHRGDPNSELALFRLFMRKKARALIVHGELLKKELAASGRAAEDRIHIVPHGAFFIYKKWDDESAAEEDMTILFFGRISEYKGIDVLLESVPLIQKDVPDLKVIIAGRGDSFETFAERVKDRRVFEIHNRFIANPEVARFFRRTSLVVLPYKEASQSGVVPIAYAFGKPVVATNVGSIPEVVADGITGFVIPPNNPAKLAEVVIRILKDSELRTSMGRNAKKKASTELSWENVAQKTVQVYKSVSGHE